MNHSLIKPIMVWLGLVLLSAILFAKTQIHDMESHNRLVNTLGELQAVDATLNQDVIRARYRLLVNYDPLVEAIGKSDRLLQQVRQTQHQNHGKESHSTEIDAKLAQLTETLKQKAVLVDYFKSDNAVLKNSLSYYPLALQQISVVETTMGATKVRLPAGLRQLGPDLLGGILQYIQSGDPERREAAEMCVNAVRDYAGTPALRPGVEHAVRHTEIILEYADRVEAQLAQILALPSARQADELYQAYATEHEQSMREANNYRILLYLFSVLLLIYTAYIFYRLRDSAHALFREKVRAQVTLHSIADAVITTDVQGCIEYMNPVAEHLTGWHTAEVMGQPIKRALRLTRDAPSHSVKSRTTVSNATDETVTDKKQQVLLTRRGGTQISIDKSVSPIRDQGGTVMGEIHVFHDVTEERRLASQLSWQATHDLLTGLVNRHEFEHRVEQALADTRERGLTHAVLYIDLDQFKIVNDSCGHAAGDELLRQLGGLLAAKVRDNDTVARLGGDEFGVLLESCPLEQARHIADNLLHAIKGFRFAWRGRPFDIGASIGLVAVDRANADLTEVLSAADMACYAAKDGGRNRVHPHDETDPLSISRRNEMQ
ncbi:MAG: DAHL domain-containing protein [Pseudomonadota bacterium]